MTPELTLSLSPLSPLHLRSLRKWRLVERLAREGVAFVSFDPRAGGASMPPDWVGPMVTVRISYRFDTALRLTEWGFEQFCTFSTTERWDCRAPWEAVFRISSSGGVRGAGTVAFPEDAPADGPLGYRREVV